MEIIEHKPPEPVILPSREMIVFFNGPDLGSPNWQSKGIDFLGSIALSETIHVLNPRRYSSVAITSEQKRQQVRWEKLGRKQTKNSGGVNLFWLAAQEMNLEHPPNREYAKTTKKELERTVGWLEENPSINVVLGVDPDFGGLDTYTQDTIDESGLRVYNSLEETCLAALMLVLK